MLRRPMMVHDGYITIEVDEFSGDELDGVVAYGPDDKDVGKVDGLVLSADKETVDRILFDIGGFLGIGAHKVALTPAEVQIMRQGNGSNLRVYVDATKSELEAQPEYKE